MLETLLVLAIASCILLLTLFVRSQSNVKKLQLEIDNREQLANESYNKFLLDSRNWAFEYIEEVQKALAEFATKVEPQLSYFEQYGKDLSGPHQIIINVIDEAYNDLKKILPENNEEKNNND